MADLTDELEFHEEGDPDGGGADAGDCDLREQIRTGREVPLDPAPLEAFFTSLARMERGDEGVVRVLHWGDSHTAADFMTTSVRRALQDRFGDGGRGFVLLGKPWKSYRPKDVETGARGDWTSERIRIAVDPALLDGFYGLGGVTTEARERDAQTWVSTTDATGYGDSVSEFDLFYLLQPGGGSFEAMVDGEVKATVSTVSRQKRTGFISLEVEEGEHQLTVRLVGDGPVRLFGASLENDGPGITYESLGVNGGFFHTPLRWDGDTLEEQVERRDPDLIVTMYGSNEADSRTINRESYKEMVMGAMKRFRAGALEASCLMLGPPDRRFKVRPEERLEQLAWIIDIQREVADELGCAFMDLREMMGGAGAHEIWGRQSPPLAQPDGVHLTVRGYEVLGAAVAHRLLQSYETWSTSDDGAMEP